MIDYKLIGARIKEAREKANITQEVLAEKADITVVYLSKIENGKVHPSLETLYDVCTPISLELGVALGNAVTESDKYQCDEISTLFQSLSAPVKPIALELLKQLSKI